MRLPALRFSMRAMMAAVAIIALCLIQAQLAMLLLISSGSVFAGRSLLDRSTDGRSARWAVAYFVTLACLYLPFAWVLGDYPWDGYRRHWIKLWPVLPGLIAGMFLHPNDSAMVMASGTATVFFVTLFTYLGSFGHAALVAANGIALIGSIVESWFAYQLFLS